VGREPNIYGARTPIFYWVIIIIVFFCVSNASASEYQDEEIIKMFSGFSTSKSNSLVEPAKKGIIKAQFLLLQYLASSLGSDDGQDGKGRLIEIYAWSKTF